MRARPRLVRTLVIGSAIAFVALAVAAVPSAAECMAPEVTFQRPALLALFASLALVHLACAFVSARRFPGVALAFLVAAHASASFGLERVSRWDPGTDHWHAAHHHGPWGLVRDEAGDGTALLAQARFNAAPSR